MTSFAIIASWLCVIAHDVMFVLGIVLTVASLLAVGLCAMRARAI
jgi:hypothetical protein